MRQCPKKMHKVIKFNQRTFRDIKLGIFIKQKGEEIIWCQNQIITLQSFSQTICWQQK